MSDEQSRFEEDYEIWKSLPEYHRIAIADIFRTLVNLALKALGLPRAAASPPSPEPPKPARRREAP